MLLALKKVSSDPLYNHLTSYFNAVFSRYKCTVTNEQVRHTQFSDFEPQLILQVIGTRAS